MIPVIGNISKGCSKYFITYIHTWIQMELCNNGKIFPMLATEKHLQIQAAEKFCIEEIIEVRIIVMRLDINFFQAGFPQLLNKALHFFGIIVTRSISFCGWREFCFPGLSTPFGLLLVADSFFVVGVFALVSWVAHVGISMMPNKYFPDLRQKEKSINCHYITSCSKGVYSTTKLKLKTK